MIIVSFLLFGVYYRRGPDRATIQLHQNLCPSFRLEKLSFPHLIKIINHLFLHHLHGNRPQILLPHKMSEMQTTEWARTKTGSSVTEEEFDRSFKPKGAIAFFILLIILGAVIWFGIYFLMLQRA